MAIQQPAPSSLSSVAARRAAYLQIMRRRIRPGRGSSLELLRSRERIPMPDLSSLLRGARHVIVGGTATSLYMPARTTKDVDILVTASDAPSVEESLRRAGATSLGPLTIDNPLRIEGNSWRLADGSDLDVLRSAQSWVGDALEHPSHDVAGSPIISLPYLVLMKLASGRGVDMGDLSRMLGSTDEGTLDEARRVVLRYLPDAVDDLESLAELGRLEFQVSLLKDADVAAPPQPPSSSGADEVWVEGYERGGKKVRGHHRQRPHR